MRTGAAAAAAVGGGGARAGSRSSAAAGMPPLVRYRPQGPHAVGLADLAWLHPDGDLHPSKHLVGRVYCPSSQPPGWWRWPAAWLPGARWAWGFVVALLPASSAAAAGLRGALLRLSLTALILALGNTAFLPATSCAALLPPSSSAIHAATGAQGLPDLLTLANRHHRCGRALDPSRCPVMQERTTNSPPPRPSLGQQVAAPQALLRRPRRRPSACPCAW